MTRILAREYGPGGFDPSAVNSNIVFEVVDHGDGTGMETRYDSAGEVIATVALSGLPTDEPTDARAAAVAAASRARQEVAGFSETSGTRQAVEALAEAVEALTT